MVTFIKKISLDELASMVNFARKQNVGYEFSFGEGCEAVYNAKSSDVYGWHTCTKINDKEVCMRYMGGVCFGLITDTDVDKDDILTYLDTANVYGGGFDGVYVECKVKRI